MANSIDQSVLIRVPRERVFEALATSAGWDAWFTDGATIDPRPGGEFHLRWRDFGPEHLSTEDLGQVVEIDPPRRFAFIWHLPDYITTVTIELETDPEGTQLLLHEEGFLDSPEGIQQLAWSIKVWAEALTSLKFSLENALGLEVAG